MSELRFSDELLVSEATKERLWALKERNGFRNFDETLSFLLDFYETATRRKLLVEELEGQYWKGYMDALKKMKEGEEV